MQQVIKRTIALKNIATLHMIIADFGCGEALLAANHPYGVVRRWVALSRK